MKLLITVFFLCSITPLNAYAENPQATTATLSGTAQSVHLSIQQGAISHLTLTKINSLPMLGNLNFGLVKFNIETPPTSTSITISMGFNHTPLPADTVLYTVDGSGNFNLIPSTQWDFNRSNGIDLSLEDAGAYDLDGVPNGMIDASIIVTIPTTLAVSNFNERVVSPTDDHGNSMATATPINVDSYNLGSIETAGDQDYFKIQIPSLGSQDINTSRSTIGYLIDNTGTVLDTSRNIVTTYQIDTGTYYIVVRHLSENETGNYALETRFYPYDSYYPYDPVNNGSVYFGFGSFDPISWFILLISVFILRWRNHSYSSLKY